MMASFWKSLGISLLVTLAAAGALAWLVSRTFVTPPPERIMTDAFQMDLAPGWSCEQDDLAWTCVPGGPEEQTSVVAVFAMKYRGSEDTPEVYVAYLREPKPVRTRDGGTELSAVEYVKVSRIGGYDWVDAMHLGSEIGNYYTQYLATVTSHIAILVSFSAHKEDFDRYNPELKQMIRSLLVYQQRVGQE
jgi:hypothetical protein